METFGIIFLCVVACLAVWCMAKFGVFAPCFERPTRPGTPKMKNPPAPSQPEWVKFNLNDEIRVKLTDAGYGILAYLHNKNWFPGHVQRDAESFRDEADAEGYTTFQVWKFIMIFGPHLRRKSDFWNCHVLLRSNDIQLYTPKS